MSKRALPLRFSVHLERHDIPEFDRPKGPLFHRWLPDGENDAINIPMHDQRNQLRIWIERRGFVDNQFIKFDPHRSEVDTETMHRQAKLESGPLRGELKLGTITQSEVDCVRNDQINSQQYIRVGKTVCEIIARAISYVVDILRAQYGQFWIAEFEGWNSKVYTLGAYCRNVLGLEWRDEETGRWGRFQPTDQAIRGPLSPLPGRENQEYLTEEDWRRLQSDILSGTPLGLRKTGGSIPLALSLVGKSQELRIAGHVRQALIEAATALEVALSSFCASCEVDGGDQRVFKDRCGLALSLTIVGRTSRRIHPDLLKKAVKGVELRNAIVHEGAEPPKEYFPILSAMLKAAVALLGLDEHKMPVLYGGNELAPRDWQKPEPGSSDVA